MDNRIKISKEDFDATYEIETPEPEKKEETPEPEFLTKEEEAFDLEMHGEEKPQEEENAS